MPITHRAYSGIDDLHKIQAATAQWINSAGFCGYLHVGDIALRLFNGMRRYNPSEIVRLWEDGDGNLLGWGIIYPRWDSFDALLHPAHRGGELENALLDWCEHEISAWLRKEKRAESPIRLEVCTGDTTRVALLEQRGFIRDSQLDDVTGVRSLTEPIPDVTLPEGFSIRPIEGLHEAEKIVAAQNASFGWSWTAEDYRRVMQSPGYQAENQLVIVAPEGRLVAFCYLMFDDWNKIGMIEDVGTHPDFQRKGLARALLYEGMRRMQAKGIVSVLIPYFAADVPASGLYTSVGFRVEYRNYIFTKTIARN